MHRVQWMHHVGNQRTHVLIFHASLDSIKRLSLTQRPGKCLVLIFSLFHVFLVNFRKNLLDNKLDSVKRWFDRRNSIAPPRSIWVLFLLLLLVKIRMQGRTCAAHVHMLCGLLYKDGNYQWHPIFHDRKIEG